MTGAWGQPAFKAQGTKRVFGDAWDLAVFLGGGCVGRGREVEIPVLPLDA